MKAAAEGRHWHGAIPETVQAEVIAQVEHLKDQRAYYMAMQQAYPNNCAWGNLVLRYDQQINEMLRSKGNWYGLERQREPLSYIGVKNRDYHDVDEERDMLRMMQMMSEYKRNNGIPEDQELSLRDTAKMLLSMPYRP